jgi:hypothetical protein
MLNSSFMIQCRSDWNSFHINNNDAFDAFVARQAFNSLFYFSLWTVTKARGYHISRMKSEFIDALHDDSWLHNVLADRLVRKYRSAIDKYFILYMNIFSKHRNIINSGPSPNRRIPTNDGVIYPCILSLAL